MPQTYELTEAEAKDLDVILTVREECGQLVQMDRFGEAKRGMDGKSVAADYVAIRGKKHLVDRHGNIWRMAAKGTPKMSGGQGGSPWRYDHVEMWTGKWRRLEDGRYAKRLVWINLATNVNAHPGIANIDWYMQTKGYKRPLDPPHTPSAKQVAAMDGKDLEDKNIIYAKMEERLGEAVAAGRINAEAAEEAKADARAAMVKPKRPKRSNKRAAG